MQTQMRRQKLLDFLNSYTKCVLLKFWQVYPTIRTVLEFSRVVIEKLYSTSYFDWFAHKSVFFNLEKLAFSEIVFQLCAYYINRNSALWDFFSWKLNIRNIRKFNWKLHNLQFGLDKWLSFGWNIKNNRAS